MKRAAASDGDAVRGEARQRTVAEGSAAADGSLHAHVHEHSGGHAAGIAGPSFTAPSAVTSSSIDTSSYEAQLSDKIGKLKLLFQDLPMPEVEVHPGPATHYRMRAEFNLYGTKAGFDERPRYVMFATAPSAGPEDAAGGAQDPPDSAGEDAAAEGGDAAGEGEAAGPNADKGDGPSTVEEEAGMDAGSGGDATAAAAVDGGDANGSSAPADGKKGKRKGWRGKKRGGGKPAREVVEVTSFPVGSELMNELMPLVLARVSEDAILRDGLFQVNYHTALSGDAMVTLVYRKKLDDAWTQAATRLRAALAAGAPSLLGHVPHIIGRSRKQKLLLERDYVEERLSVSGRLYVYRQHEGAFSQPNARVCEKMLAWAVDVTKGSGDHDLLELYCGNGNFTVPLAQNFRRVVATEISKVGVDAARWNMEANGVKDKAFVGRLSSEEFVETWKAKGTRRRLEGLWPWSELDLRTLFVDPPRAGLDAESVSLMATFERIVYISCNPETLRANLGGIAGVTHDVVRFAAFDQFPYTHHLETGVYLVRRPENKE